MKFHNLDEQVKPTCFRNTPGLLFVFVVLSLLLHGSTLLFSPVPDTQLPESRFGTSIISAVLSSTNDRPATAPAHKQTTPIDKNKPEDKTPKPKQEKVAATFASKNKNAPIFSTKTKAAPEKPQSKSHSTEPTITKAANVPTPLPTQSSARQQVHQRNYVLGEVQNQLSKYLTYPQRARRRGWQGQVLVAIHITHQGQLNNVRLAQSSGYALLDNSAITAIARLGQISLPESLGPLQAMDLLLPVSYQLREG
jgi:protein TonB